MATIAQTQQAVERVWQATMQHELHDALQAQLRAHALLGVHAALEAALLEEVLAYRAAHAPHVRRAGYAPRRVLTSFGLLPDVGVPKLRTANAERSWQILARYQLATPLLLDQALYLYTLGLSIRDLQEAIFVFGGHMLSPAAINRVTIAAQAPMQQWRQRAITDTPPVLIVDGVWMTILGPTGETWTDRAGHERREMRGHEQVMLAVMGVWPDGRHQILHYALADDEGTEAWAALFADLIRRGLDPAQVQVVSSDGVAALPGVIATAFPYAEQQRCIEHVIRGLEKQLSYGDLPQTTETGEPLRYEDACRQRRQQVWEAAHAVFEAPTRPEAEARLAALAVDWQVREPTAVRVLQEQSARCLTFYRCPQQIHHLIRSTNLLERFFREFRTKADEIGSFPNDMTALVVFHLIVTRDDAKHDRGRVAQT